MELKSFIILFAVLLCTTTAFRKKVISRTQCSPKLLPQTSYFSNIASQFPAIIETRDYIIKYKGNEQVILPPQAVELPRGLGYFPSALPLVAKAFEPALDYSKTDAYIPVTSPCDRITLAAPVPPDWSTLVKPIIL